MHPPRQTAHGRGQAGTSRTDAKGTSTMNDINATLTKHGLTRPTQGRVLGGVCAGLGRQFGLEPVQARLLFVLAMFVLPGSQLLVYPILWILMPSERPQEAAENPGPATPAAPACA